MKRRDFIKAAAAAAAVACVPGRVIAVGAKKLEVPPLPWKYEKLDPEYVRKLGHLGYYMFECAGGVFWAIMTALREKVGYPFTLIPLPSKEDVIDALEMNDKPYVIPMQYGFAGVLGMGTLCGTLNGAVSAINYVRRPTRRKTRKLVEKLFRYYESHPFPTDTSNRYAENHEFLVPHYKTDRPLPQSISHSVLCHVSVSRWCLKSGYGSKTKERSERCARLAGDIAAMAVTLLNAELDGRLEEVLPVGFSHETAECMSCHKPGKRFEKGEFIKGKMECLACHRDLRPHIAENKLRTAFGIEVRDWMLASIVGAGAGVGAHAAVRALRGSGKSDEEDKS